MPRPQPLFQLHRLLAQSARGATLARIMNTLRVSRPTAFRLIKELRESFSAPLEYDRKTKTYRYASGAAIELPGSWLNHEEWTLVLGLVQSLSKGDQGPLKPLLSGLGEKLALWSAQLGEDASQWGNKVRFVSFGERKVKKGILQSILSSLHANSQLRIRYLSPLDKESEITERVISPFRLVRYRDNWYVDAYCHLRLGLRSFSLSQIKTAHILEQSAKEINEAEREAFYGESYGIFSGRAKNVACLIFSGTAAKLASRESWHPKQTVDWLPNGHWQIRFPYNDSRELVRDICRWSDGLVSISPQKLKAAVLKALQQGAKSLL
jgi:proteasome accessory factor C